MKKSLLIFILVVLASGSTAQGGVDSLEKALNTVTGREKVEILAELTEANCDEDPEKAVDYGRWGLGISSVNIFFMVKLFIYLFCSRHRSTTSSTSLMPPFSLLQASVNGTSALLGLLSSGISSNTNLTGTVVPSPTTRASLE